MAAIPYDRRRIDITASAVEINSENPKKIIYIGPSLEAVDTNKIISYFKDKNIKFVLNTAMECRFCYHDIKDITYKKIYADDSTSQDMTQYFDSVSKFIDFAFDNDSNVYLNCAAGISRSSTLLIAYLMKKNNMEFTDAYKYVKVRRYIIKPNISFIQQLKEYEKLLESQLNNKDLESFYNIDNSSAEDIAKSLM